VRQRPNIAVSLAGQLAALAAAPFGHPRCECSDGRRPWRRPARRCALATWRSRSGHEPARTIFENLLLRQQLQVALRCQRRPRLRARDKLFWLLVRHLLGNWRRHLLLVRPETVLRGHRQGWRRFWYWRSHYPLGRPRLTAEVRSLIATMAREPPLGHRADPRRAAQARHRRECPLHLRRLRLRKPLPRVVTRSSIIGAGSPIDAPRGYGAQTFASYRLDYADTLVRRDGTRKLVRQLQHTGDCQCELPVALVISERDRSYGVRSIALPRREPSKAILMP
jgi:hypothetical protein